MKVYTNLCPPSETDDYIGRWYTGQYLAQRIFLRLCGEEYKTEFDYENLGGGYSQNEWNNIDLRIYFNCNPISCEEANSFLEEHQQLIEDLHNSYKSEYRLNGYHGEWDENIKEKLEKFAEKFTSELVWNEDDYMEEEKQNEELEEQQN